MPRLRIAVNDCTANCDGVAGQTPSFELLLFGSWQMVFDRRSLDCQPTSSGKGQCGRDCENEIVELGKLVAGSTL